MELTQAIYMRRSTRKFLTTPIPDEWIEEMLEAARRAPSPGNGQGHVFGVIKDAATKQLLAEAAGKQLWIADAPVVFACCADIGWDIAEQPEDDFGLIVNKLRFGVKFIDYMNRCPDRKTCSTIFANAAPMIPAEHIFLTAVAHGLSACFIGYLDIKAANQILRLPENLACTFLLPVGYAAETPQEKQLKELSEIVFYEQWDA